MQNKTASYFATVDEAETFWINEASMPDMQGERNKFRVSVFKGMVVSNFLVINPENLRKLFCRQI